MLYLERQGVDVSPLSVCDNYDVPPPLPCISGWLRHSEQCSVQAWCVCIMQSLLCSALPSRLMTVVF